MTKKVLIVDDSSFVRAEISKILEPTGCEILEASDGQQGLNLIAEHPDTALILLDVNMPRMDGIVMLERMRAAGHQNMVVMMTTEGNPRLIQRAKDAGAKAWVVKQVANRKLEQVVLKLLG